MPAEAPNEADVKILVEIPPDLDAAAQTALIESASETAGIFVTEDLAAAGLSDARLNKIWLFLTCHFVLMTTERGGLTSSRTGDQSQETYGGATVFKQGLSMTRFGNQAIALDTSGTLAAMVADADPTKPSTKEALFRVAGSKPNYSGIPEGRDGLPYYLGQRRY